MGRVFRTGSSVTTAAARAKVPAGKLPFEGSDRSSRSGGSGLISQRLPVLEDIPQIHNLGRHGEVASHRRPFKRPEGARGPHYRHGRGACNTGAWSGLSLRDGGDCVRSGRLQGRNGSIRLSPPPSYESRQHPAYRRAVRCGRGGNGPTSPPYELERPSSLLGRGQVGPVRRHSTDQRIPRQAGSVSLGQGRTPGLGNLRRHLPLHRNTVRIIREVEQSGIVLPKGTLGTHRFANVGPAHPRQKEWPRDVRKHEVLHLASARRHANHSGPPETTRCQAACLRVVTSTLEPLRTSRRTGRLPRGTVTRDLRPCLDRSANNGECNIPEIVIVTLRGGHFTVPENGHPLSFQPRHRCSRRVRRHYKGQPRDGPYRGPNAHATSDNCSFPIEKLVLVGATGQSVPQPSELIGHIRCCSVRGE